MRLNVTRDTTTGRPPYALHPCLRLLAVAHNWVHSVPPPPPPPSQTGCMSTASTSRYQGSHCYHSCIYVLKVTYSARAVGSRMAFALHQESTWAPQLINRLHIRLWCQKNLHLVFSMSFQLQPPSREHKHVAPHCPIIWLASVER